MIYRNSSPHPRRLLLKVVASAGVIATALACSQDEGSDKNEPRLIDAGEVNDGHVVGFVPDAHYEYDAAVVLDSAPGVLADAQPDVDSSGPVGVVPDSGTP